MVHVFTLSMRTDTEALAWAACMYLDGTTLATKKWLHAVDIHHLINMYIINVVKKKLLYTCTCTRRVHSSKWSFIPFFLAVPGVFGPTLAFLTGLKKKKKLFYVLASISLKLYMFLDIHCTYWYMYMYIYAYIMWLFHYFIYTHTFTCERNNFNNAFFKYKHSKCSIDKLKQKQFYKQVFSYLDIEISRYEIYFWHLTSTK